jgi:hypothetical protein
MNDSDLGYDLEGDFVTEIVKIELDVELEEELELELA